MNIILQKQTFDKYGIPYPDELKREIENAISDIQAQITALKEEQSEIEFVDYPENATEVEKQAIDLLNEQKSDQHASYEVEIVRLTEMLEELNG